MQADRKDTAEVFEVNVGREDREVAPNRDGTDEEVCIGALDPLGSALVETRGGFLIVEMIKRHVWESTKTLAKELELGVRLDPRKKLLSNRAHHHDPTLVYQLSQFIDDHVASFRSPTQRKRPDRRVDQHVHLRRLCFL